MGSWIEITASDVTTRHNYDPLTYRDRYGLGASIEIANWANNMVEQLILEGHNHIEVKWSFPPNHYRLNVPIWWMQPIKRLYIEWGRWRYRRGASQVKGEGDG